MVARRGFRTGNSQTLCSVMHRGLTAATGAIPQAPFQFSDPDQPLHMPEQTIGCPQPHRCRRRPVIEDDFHQHRYRSATTPAADAPAPAGNTPAAPRSLPLQMPELTTNHIDAVECAGTRWTAA